MSDGMIEIAQDQIRNLVGEDGLAKAEIVASRAALMRQFDPEIDMPSLVVGLHIGNDGEMPETVNHGLMGMVLSLAIGKYNEISVEPDSGLEV